MTEKKHHSSDEELPVLIIWKSILQHKKGVIIAVLIALAAVGAYCGYSKYQSDKSAKEAVMQQMKHLTEITGTYENGNVELVLNIDNTATLVTNKGRYNEATHFGHWEEKAEDIPIEINFSDAFRADMCGESDGYFSSLYFFYNTLWPSIDAIQSKDYTKAEVLNKQKDLPKE